MIGFVFGVAVGMAAEYAFQHYFGSLAAVKAEVAKIESEGTSLLTSPAAVVKDIVARLKALL